MSDEPKRKTILRQAQDERIGAITPNKNRLLQQTKPPNRKLFDARRKATFLEVFAATCNVRLAAEKAGVAYQTVFKHRMKDAAFAAAWDEALSQGYAYLEARLLQQVHESDTFVQGPSVSLREPPPHPAEPNREDLHNDGKPFDAELALTLLREHARRLPGSGDQRKRQRTTAGVASEAEVIAALTKRLKTFAVRGRGARGPGD